MTKRLFIAISVVILVLFVFTSEAKSLSKAGPRPLKVDIWEDNTVVDVNGFPGIHQVILWRMREYKGVVDYFVVGYRHADNCRYPYFNNGVWKGRFGDTVVHSRMAFTTVTSFDPEVEDSRRLHAEKRK